MNVPLLGASKVLRATASPTLTPHMLQLHMRSQVLAVQWLNWMLHGMRPFYDKALLIERLFVSAYS